MSAGNAATASKPASRRFYCLFPGTVTLGIARICAEKSLIAGDGVENVIACRMARHGFWFQALAIPVIHRLSG
jgi:hypothetical protein